MPDPYRMVAVNVIGVIILATALIIRRFIFKKKKINFFILLLIISILPIVNIFREGTYESGDFNIHIYRIMSFFDTLKEGILMPSWAAELNATYGNPLFIFNYPLPYYGVSFFHLLGFTFISAMKIYFALNLFLSGIFMYICVKGITTNKLASFTAAIFYIFNPYHLIDIHFRATLGETTVFTVAPLLLFSVVKYFKTGNPVFLVFNSFLTGVLFLAHPLLGIIFLGIIFLFSIFNWVYKKRFYGAILTTISLIAGVIAGSYTWIPFLLYNSYTFPNPSNILSFNPVQQLFYSPWRLGFLFQGPYGELALMIGYTQIIVLLITLFVVLNKLSTKNIRSDQIFWLFIFSFLFFIMTPLSAFLWKPFPIFWMLIPTGRLLLPVAFVTSLLAGFLGVYLSSSSKKRLYLYILITITILYTILNWGHRTMIPEIKDEILRKSVWKSTLTEGTTAYFLNNRWADINNFWFDTLPKSHLEALRGKISVNEFKRSSIEHNYIVDTETSTTIREATLYFPGWKLESNGRPIKIYPGERGVIYAQIPSGLQHLVFSYEDLLPYKFAKILSVFIFLALTSSLTIYFVLGYLKRKTIN